jgi:phage protein D
MADIVSFPLLQVYLDDRWLPEGVLQGLTGLRLQQRLSQPSLCELYFRDPPGPLDFLASVSPGQELRVSLLGTGQELFRGDVTALEYHYLEESQREVYLRAYDRLHRLRKRQSVRSFENVDLVSLARGLCKDLGLAELNLPRSNLSWPLFVQHNQNDLELLVEMAALEGMYLTVRGQELYLTTLEGLPGDPIRLNLEENLYEAHLEVNVDAACEKVVAWGWNPSQVELARGEATKPRLGRRVRARVSVAAARTPERSLVNETAPSREHADTLAQADLDRRSASEVTFSGVAQGNSGLQPGSLVEVFGVASNVSGRYVLTQATHRIDASGYRTELDTAPPEVVPRLRADIATFGEVFDVSDPQGWARVRVRLPAYNSVRTGWLPVAMPGAGPGKGLIALPNVGDTVLVVLLRENPGLGLVLGGLFGKHKAPESGVELDRVRTYTWITPGNQRIQLHDEPIGGKIRLENGAGAYIELDGDHITIAGGEIDFERA